MSPTLTEPVFRPPQSPLVSERLVIRELKRSDLKDLFAVHSVDAVNRYLPYDTWHDHADAEAWMARVEDRVSDGKAMQFVVCDRRLDRAIGSCILFGYEEADERAELGYAIGQSYWGQGFAREAMQRFLCYVFEEVQLRRLEARVDSRNLPSSGLLLRLGFSKEGCLREWAGDQQDLIDMELFGLLQHEWQRLDTQTS